MRSDSNTNVQQNPQKCQARVEADEGTITVLQRTQLLWPAQLSRLFS